MANYVRHNINANAEMMRYVLKYKGFRLIAAKVVMEWAVDQIEDSLDFDHQDALEGCKAAIAKARGAE